MSSEQDPSRDPELEKLLPWYVNGTLAPDEAAKVEAYIESHPEAQKELAFLQGLRAEIKKETGHSPGELGLARLKKQLAETPSAPPSSAGIPRWWRGLAVAACLLLMVQTAGIMTYPQFFATDDPGRTTRGNGNTADRAMIEVRFAPDATEAEIRELLRKIGATIAAGPDEKGRYRLALAAAKSDRTAIQQALNTLRGKIRIVASAHEAP